MKEGENCVKTAIHYHGFYGKHWKLSITWQQ